jgi:integrase
MQQTAIKTSISTSVSTKSKPKPRSRLEVDFDRIVTKYKAEGLNMVADFLQTKARRSFSTALMFSHGLQYLNDYTRSRYSMDLEQIIATIKKGKIDVYTMLNSFVTYLQKETPNGPTMMPRTIISYMTSARSYLGYVDVDIAEKKFQYRVSMPTLYKEDEQALDASDIREIIVHCDNLRLKAYLLVLASGGMRAMEALAIREADINWNGIDFADPADVLEPTTVKMRREYSKTRRERHIFISNEAARCVNDWLNWRDRNQSPGARAAGRDDLVFGRAKHPSGLYSKMRVQFRRALTKANRSTKKEDGIARRGLVTFHSFRRFVKTTIANQTRNSDYSEWFLGHFKSPYYTNKPEELKRIYKEDCMKYLTFLDYPTLEATGRSFEAQLKQVVKQKDKEIEDLKQQIREISQEKDDEANRRTTEVGQLMAMIKQNEKRSEERFAEMECRLKQK